MIFIYLLLILVASVVLMKAADVVVISISKVGRLTRANYFFITSVLLAFGNSLPDLFLAITSSLDGSPSLSLGNVIGSNITKLTLVSGVSAIIFASVQVQGSILKKELGITILAGLAPFLLIIDGELSRVDGLILISLYGAYVSSMFRAKYIRDMNSKNYSTNPSTFLRQLAITGKHSHQDIARLFWGLALLLGSSEVIVRLAGNAAQIMQIPIFLVGLVIISLGTTLPELAFSIRSLSDHHPTMFFGNLLGSMIANSTLVIGIASIILPIRDVYINNYFYAFFVFVVVSVLFWMFTHSKKNLSRWEGIVLVLFYICFIAVEFILGR
mgnify:CR=1 FL=1